MAVDLSWDPPSPSSISGWNTVGYYLLGWHPTYESGSWFIVSPDGIWARPIVQYGVEYDWLVDPDGLMLDSTTVTDYNPIPAQGYYHYQIMAVNNDGYLNKLARIVMFPDPEILTDNLLKVQSDLPFNSMDDFFLVAQNISRCADPHMSSSTNGCPNLMTTSFEAHGIVSITYYNDLTKGVDGDCGWLMWPMGKWSCVYHDKYIPMRKLTNQIMGMNVYDLCTDYRIEVVFEGCGLRIMTDRYNPWDLDLYVKEQTDIGGGTFVPFSGNSGLSGSCSLNWVSESSVPMSKIYTCYMGGKTNWSSFFDGFQIGDPFQLGVTEFPNVGFFLASGSDRKIIAAPPDPTYFTSKYSTYLDQPGVSYFERVFNRNENKRYKVLIRDKGTISISDYNNKTGSIWNIYSLLSYYTFPGAIMSIGVIRKL